MSGDLTGSVRAYAPGSVGNVGPGLDVLGLAVTGAGDTVTASLRDDATVVIEEPGHAELPRDAERNSAGIAAREVLARAGSQRGVTLSIEKGLPLSGGQGGSAASAVAAAVAVNALLGQPLGFVALLESCLVAEAAVAGRHLDNIAPSLLGGLVLIRSLEPMDVVRIATPEALRIVLAHPDQRVRTAEARAVLPAHVPRAVALHQAAQVAAIVAACLQGDLALLGRAIDDRIAEPARGPRLTGFADAKAAALAAGALGASISGSGPTIFALVRGDSVADLVRRALAQAYEAHGLACTVRVASVDGAGARVTSSLGVP